MSRLSCPRGARAALGSAVLAVLAVLAAPAVVAGPAASASPTVAIGPRPAFSLPFGCGSRWRLDTWDHSPAVDIVREPQSDTAGSPVLASASGTVDEAGHQSGAGNYVLIDHGGSWYTVSLHLRDLPLVKAGQAVAKGARLGYVGHSGTTSNGVDHLHYEQLVDENGDGHLDWGVDASQDGTSDDGEDVAAVFDATTYTGDGGEWRNVVSANTCSSPPAPATSTVTTFADAPGYGSPTSTTRTGTLRKGRNYVYCKVAGRRVTQDGHTNSWWLLTDLDTGSPWRRQYVSAYYLARWGDDEARDDSGRVIATCR